MRKNKKAHHASKTRHKLVVYYNDYRLDFLQLILSKISGKYIERENNIIHQSIQHHRGINPPHSVGLIGPLGLNPRPLPRNPLPRPRPAPKQTHIISRSLTVVETIIFVRHYYYLEMQAIGEGTPKIKIYVAKIEGFLHTKRQGGQKVLLS